MGMALRSTSNQRERGCKNRCQKEQRVVWPQCSYNYHAVKLSLNFPKSQVPLHHNPKCPSFPIIKNNLPQNPSSSIRKLSCVFHQKPIVKCRLPSTVVKSQTIAVASLGLETLFKKWPTFTM